MDTNKQHTNQPDPRNASTGQPCGCRERRRYLVTASIPVADNTQDLETCLNSLLDQTRLPDEVLLLNAEGDETIQRIADRYNCAVINTPKNHLKTRHLGIVEASGDVVLNCNPHTWYPHTYVEKMVDPIENGAVGTMAYLKSDDLNGPMRTVLNSLMDIQAGGLHMPRGANAVLKDAYLEAGGYRPTPRTTQKTGITELREEEVEFPKRLADVGDVVRIDDVAHTNTELPGNGQIINDLANNVPKTLLYSLAASAIGIVATTSPLTGKLLTGAGLGFAAGELGAKIVGQNTVMEEYRGGEKVELAHETDVHFHHDLAGLFLLGTGALLKTPTAAGAGLGLLGHHLATEGASFLGAIAKKEDRGKEVKIPIDPRAGVYEVVEL